MKKTTFVNKLPQLGVFVFLMDILIASILFSGVSFAKNINSESNEPFDFALLADLGYSSLTIPHLEEMLNLINEDSDIKFSIFAGDLGAPVCNHETNVSRFNRLNSMSAPMVVTPGDNDWSNCLDPYGNLSDFRQIFYYDLMKNPNTSVAASLGQNKLKLIRQNGKEGLVENQSWTYNNVMFATIHVVGDGDACEVWDPIGNETIGSVDNIPSSCVPEKLAREKSNVKWLKRVFEKATEEGLAGIVIATQKIRYEQGKVLPDGRCVDQSDMKCKIHETYRVAINSLVKDFAKPVALLYGDEHLFSVAYPFPEEYPYFSNVQTMGNPDTGYVRVSVDESTPELFSFSQGYCRFKRNSVNCDPDFAGKNQVIAGSTVQMLTNKDSCGDARGRSCESLVGNVITDAIRSETGTDFALYNSGGIRNGLTCAFPHDLIQGQPCPKEDFKVFPYQITDGKIILSIPFGNQISTFGLSGIELKSWLENGISTPPNHNGRYPQVSGLCFTWDIGLPVGSRIVLDSVVRQSGDGSCTGDPIDLTGTDSLEFSMSAPAFLSFPFPGSEAGGDDYPAILPLERQTLFGLDQDLVINQLSGRTISPLIQGRVNCIDTNLDDEFDCPVTLP